MASQKVLLTKPLEVRRAGDAFSVETSQGGRMVLDVIPAKKVYRVLGPPALLHWLVQCGLSRTGELSHLQMTSKRSAARVAFCTPVEAKYQCMLGALPHLAGYRGSPIPSPDGDWCVLTEGAVVYFADSDEDGSFSNLATTAGADSSLPHATSFGDLGWPVSSSPSKWGGASVPTPGVSPSLFSTRRTSMTVPVAVGAVDMVRLVRLFRGADRKGDSEEEASKIYLDGPHLPSAAVVSTLVNSGRFRPPGVLASIGAVGAVSAAWLPPCTRLDPPAPCGAMCVSYDTDGSGDGNDYRYFRFLPEPASDLSDSQAVESAPPLQQRYQITSDCLGGGGFGSVYRGVSKATGVMIAVKVIPVARGSDACTLKCRREYEFMQELVHPNIVQVHAFEVSGGRAMIVMELCESGTLLNLLRNFKQGLPLPALSHTLRQVLHGVRYLHLHNVVHRDMKPANVLCSASGLVKVADFGAAHRLIPGGSESTEEDAPAALTPVYASPEAIKGSVVFAQDIWALGCIAIEMVTCDPPWTHLLDQGIPMEDVTHRVAEGEVHPIPSIVSAPCKAFISGCLTQDHTARPDCSTLLGYELFLLSAVELERLDQRNADNDEPWSAPVTDPGWSAFATSTGTHGTAPLSTTKAGQEKCSERTVTDRPRPLDAAQVGSNSGRDGRDGSPSRTPAVRPDSAQSSQASQDVDYLRTLAIHRDIDKALRAVLAEQPKTRQAALALLRDHLTE
eukprot:Hpha_TRINITY_DN34248_c0_g1::TRINITY_DN34248_c0_g1_i1::g.34419::m.34419